MPPLFLWLLLALAAIAFLAGVRLFLARPREHSHDYRAAFGSDARAALTELLRDPEGATGREAELRGDWSEARAAYRRALAALGRDDPGDPAVAFKRRVLESKLEELDRLEAKEKSR